MRALPATRLLALVVAGLALVATLLVFAREPQGPLRMAPLDHGAGGERAPLADAPGVVRRRIDRDPARPEPAGTAAAMIEGRVLDGLGQPVAGCEVTYQELRSPLDEESARDDPATFRVPTGDDGRFRLVLPPLCAGVLVLSHRDFPPRIARADLAVEAGEVRGVGDLVLHSAPGIVVLVRAAADRRGIAGARVSLSPALVEVSLPSPARDLAERTAVTDADGRALLYGVGPGAYSIRVEAAQAATTEVTHVQPTAAATAPVVEIDLAAGQVIRGRLVAPQRADLGVTAVRAEAWEGGLVLRGGVAATGEFRIAGALAGRYRVMADSTRFGTAEADVIVPGESPTLHFAPGGTIAGQVTVRSSGAPLAGAQVRATPEDGWPLQRAGQSVVPSAFTDAAGRFEIVGLPEGRFHVEAASDGFVATRSPLTPTGTRDLRLDLDAGLSAVGRVQDAAGLPPAGTRVALVGADHTDTAYARWKRAVTDATTVVVTPGVDGAFEVRGIEPDQHRLAIEGAGHAPWLSEVLRGRSGDRLELGSITLTREAILRGTALDADGAPAAGATVCLDALSATGAARQVRTDRAGRFEFGELGEGEFELFYHYPERDGPLASPPNRTRTLTRVHVRAESTTTVTLAPK